MTDELITWLRGVLDEDERQRAPRLNSWTPEVHESDCPGDAECICGRPAFVLADIAAKRALLDTFEEAKRYYEGPGRAAPAGEVHGLWTAVQLIGTAYAHRPGYRDDWRP